LNLLAAVGAAWWFDKLVKLEWSYPYCSAPDSGEAAAVFGFPLPYQQVFIAGSASASFIPWLYLVNLAVIAGVFLLLLRPLLSRLTISKPRLLSVSVGAVAMILLGTAVAFEIFVLSIGVWMPASSFSEDFRYSELRPVAVHVRGRPRNCTASPFWFPNRSARSVGTSNP
jgi:hypothetical protein